MRISIPAFPYWVFTYWSLLAFLFVCFIFFGGFSILGFPLGVGKSIQDIQDFSLGLPSFRA